jgi:hypothetical protein
MVVRTTEKELTAAIETAAANPDRSTVVTVGDPRDLLRVVWIADDELSTQHIDRSTSQPHPGVGVGLA